MVSTAGGQEDKIKHSMLEIVACNAKIIVQMNATIIAQMNVNNYMKLSYIQSADEIRKDDVHRSEVCQLSG